MAFSIQTPFAIVKPPLTFSAPETKPAEPAPPPRVAARRSMVAPRLDPAALIVSVPPASQMQDHPAPTPLTDGRT